jgi:hypothetical protein
MKKAWLLAILVPTSAAASGHISGYVQEHLSYRTESKSACANLEGCSLMVNEPRVQVLGEWQSGEVSGALRVDAFHDAAIDQSDVLVRESYLDWAPSSKISARVGRQVITWGVADYLFVNDIFPKNYDAFFTGKPFDHMKEAVDAVKANFVLGKSEWELVAARPQPDTMPLSSRFAATAMLPGVNVQAANRSGTDLALRIAGKCKRWDSAVYLARHLSRDAGLYAQSVSNMASQLQSTRHVGLSMIGGAANGVVMAEMAYMDTDLRNGNMNPFLFGKQVKALVGYSTDLGDDASVSMQYHHEREMDYDAYRMSLAPMVDPAAKTRQTVYLKLQKRLYNQTLGVGVQMFAAFDGGHYLNPFASYSIADGLNLESGANFFGGETNSRYGMMKRDSNVYASLRYSF